MLHKIRSRAYLTGNDSVLAVADVNIDDAVIIRDCRLLKSADGNIEAQLPQIKNKDGTYTQTVQLINYQSVLMKSLKASIFEAYTNALKGNPPVSKEKTFEMEKEQFELENKSLVNKLKVSNVHQEELEAASAEIERLRAELKTQKENISDVEQLRMDLQQARKELSQAKDKETEIASQLEAARQDLMQREDKNSQLLKQIKELEIQLSEAQNGLKVVDEVEIKLQQFEQIKASKDEKIAQLLDNLQSVEEENKQLQARLNDLIEQKEKLEQAVTQGNVGNKNEIESLKSDLENANAMVAALRNQRQELLAQIENLKFVKNTNEKQEPETVTPVEEKQDTSSVISFEVRQDESETKSNVKTSVEESKEVTENPPKSVDTNTGEDDFPGLDSFDDNWLIPTRPDTPEMIAKRKEEEKKKREAEEQAAVEQKKAQQVDSSQMSLW